MTEAKYKRILLKLSGEALLGAKTSGIDFDVAHSIALAIKEITTMGTEVAVVVGGGNIFRGVNADKIGIKEETGHHIGMLATCINCMTLSDIFEKAGVENVVLSAYSEFSKLEPYTKEDGKNALDQGKVLLLAGGTGRPFCSTDTATAIRASELDCDLIIKMTKVDGVYDTDPVANPEAKKYESLTFDEALDQDLKVMDRDAFSVCQENNIPIRVCKMEAQNLAKVVAGDQIGTIIK